MDPQISYAADFVRFHSCPHARTCLTGTRAVPSYTTYTRVHNNPQARVEVEDAGILFFSFASAT